MGDRELVLSEDKAVEEPLEVRFSHNTTFHPIPMSRPSTGDRLFTVGRTLSKDPPGGMRQAVGLTNQLKRPVSYPLSTTDLKKPQTVIHGAHTHRR